MLNGYNGFMGLMSRGGPVMWVIFAVACLAFALLVERHVQLARYRKHAARDLGKLLNESVPPGALLDTASRSPIVWLLRRVNWTRVANHDEMVHALNFHLAELVPRLEGGLATIAVLASLLPMLGLLGTVLGMIEVFDALALNGVGRPDAMASGIAQALLTTAAGLIIAIPVIFWHHVLARRLRNVLMITEQALGFMQVNAFGSVNEKGVSHETRR